MKRCCEKSGINWNDKICPLCNQIMVFHKVKNKRKRYIPGTGRVFLRSLDEKYICQCGYSQLKETYRDLQIRNGFLDKKLGII